jgi:hypothetical protein
MNGTPKQSAAAASLHDSQTDNFDNAKFYMNDHSVRKSNELAAGILAAFQSCGVLPMRLVLWAFLIFIVCLPLAFVLYLVAAARYPSMDSFTAKLPSTVGSAVSQIALRKAGYGKDEAKVVNRAIQLDPENPDAWSRLCHLDDEAAGDEAACRKAIELRPTAWNFNGLGAAQERTGNFCAAEDSYTSAIQQTSNSALFLRNMARAALRCGHSGASVAGLEVAEGLDAKAVADPDDDDETKPDLLSDREYLAVAYDRTKQRDKAVVTCLKAHSDWKSCHCELTDKDVKCSEDQTASKR